MKLYTKLGSIPTPLPDGVTEADHLADGWLEVSGPPEVPQGHELAWLNWEWVVREPKPTDNPGMQWNWNHSEMDWVESPYGMTEIVIGSAGSAVSFGSATITFGSATGV